MDHAEEQYAETSETPPRARRAWGAALAMVGLIGAFYLLREHWNHVSGAWPYLLLLACPLMHVFHRHGGHGRHVGQSSRPGQN